MPGYRPASQITAASDICFLLLKKQNKVKKFLDLYYILCYNIIRSWENNKNREVPNEDIGSR
jgi:hypothetical protein